MKPALLADELWIARKAYANKPTSSNAARCERLAEQLANHGLRLTSDGKLEHIKT